MPYPDITKRLPSTSLSRPINTWGLALIASFILVGGFYSIFLGREYVVVENRLYDGLIAVNEPYSTQIAGMEGYGITTYGPDGLVVNKPLVSGVTNLVFWGDSFVEAIQVSDSEKFSEIIETTWNSTEKGKPAQSLNIGLAGLDTRAYLQFGENVKSIYSPDYLFLMLGNADFLAIYNSPALQEKVNNSDFTNLVDHRKAVHFRKIVNSMGLSSFISRLKKQTFAFWDIQSNQKQAGDLSDIHQRTNDEFQSSIQIQLRALKSIFGENLIVLYRQRVTDFGRNPQEGTDSELYRALVAESIAFIDTYIPLLKSTVEGKPPYGFANFPLGHGHLNKTGHQDVANAVLLFLKNNI